MIAFFALILVVVYFVLCVISKEDPDKENGCFWIIAIIVAIVATVAVCNALYR